MPSSVSVCAIGASAGGVGALQTLFRLLPDDLGLAYVVVIHLSPDHPSAMHEILGAATRMQVLQVVDGPTLQANCVYVIPPDRELVIDGNDVRARPFSDARARRAPIDMFFRSVAAGRGDGIAVVLTGAGSDGAVGVRAIKEAGGLIMVQEPAEAGYPSMPQSVIATGVADVIAPLARLAERIAEAARSKDAVRSLDGDGAANDVRRIIAFLRMRTGHDFSGYKRSTVLRRISRRMQVCQIDHLTDYARHLRDTPEETEKLFADLLISVTTFFRDQDAFAALSHRVIQPLLDQMGEGDGDGELRAWVVGCATGEEAYSLAILLLEEAETRKLHLPIQIFATDLDDGALATAREGRYPRTIEADVSADRLKRFFIDEGTHYRINRKVRDLVLFATHSVVREPPFMRLDLVTCRNVLIYLERALQQHVCAIFHYGLKPDGYLFLGTAETADTSQSQFVAIDRDARIYRARRSEARLLPMLAPTAAASPGQPPATQPRSAVSRLEAGEVLGASHAAALEAGGPPSALVDADHGVLHLSPTAGRFILLSAGPLSGKLPTIVRPELRLDLKLALDRAFEAQQPTITRIIDVVLEGAPRRVSLHVAPVPAAEGLAPRAMVFFLDNGPARAAETIDDLPPPDELQHLHGELKAAQEAELAGRIRHETAVQELRASNEELQSLNEEYRSTAEELETSKEELQSINEELQTVNAELKSKLAVISAAHNDLQNLTASSEIGTLFLDANLRIRMFTPPVAELINVTAADVGRPITNFTHRLDYDGIERDVRRVLGDFAPTETEIRSLDGRWFTMRVRPYRTLENQVEGAVVTFDDITDRKLAETTSRESEARLAFLLTLSDTLRPLDDAGEIQAAASRVLGEHLGADRVGYAEHAADSAEIVVTHNYTRGVGGLEGRHRYEDYGADMLAQLRAGHTIVRNDVAHDPRLSEAEKNAHAALELGATVNVPLVRAGRLEAVFFLHYRSAHIFASYEIAFLSETAERVWIAIEAARAKAALRASEERQAFLLKLSDAILPLAEPEAIKAAATRILGEHLGVLRAQYWESDASGEFLVSTGGYTDGASAVTESVRMDDFGAYVRESYHTGRVMAVADVAADPRVTADQLKSYDALGFRAWAGIPLVKDGRFVAALGLHNATAREWSETDIVLTRDTADRTWAALERARAEAALNESEEQQRLTLQLVPAMLWWADPTGADITANDQWKFYTGQRHGETQNFGWLDAIHPDDVEATRAAFAHAFATGEPLERQQRIRQSGDGYRWHLVRHVPVHDESGGLTRWFGAAIDIQDLRELQEHQEVLVAELQHRTRNLMGVVGATFEATLRSGDDLDAFSAKYRDRIAALARVQRLLSRLRPDERITFDKLIHDEIDAVGGAERVTLEGPAGVALRSSTVQTFALALHELATNAIKYGALAQPSGRLAVTWRFEPAGPEGRPWLHVDWRETGVIMPPADAAPQGTGQGRQLIERALPYQLGAKTTYVMGPDGVRCTIVVPVSSRTAAEEAEDDPAAS